MPGPEKYSAEFYDEAQSEYAKLVQEADLQFRALLMADNPNPQELAIAATRLNLAKAGVREAKRLLSQTSREGVVQSEIHPERYGVIPIDAWRRDLVQKARKYAELENMSLRAGLDLTTQVEVQLEKVTPANSKIYDARIKEYASLADKIKKDPQIIRSSLPENKRGPDVVWFNKSSESTQKLLDFYSAELKDWSTSYKVDEDFLHRSANEKLWEFSVDRPAANSLLRLSVKLPWDAPAPEPINMSSIENEMKREEAEWDVYDRAILPDDAADYQPRDLDNVADLTDIVDEYSKDDATKALIGSEWETYIKGTREKFMEELANPPPAGLDRSLADDDYRNSAEHLWLEAERQNTYRYGKAAIMPDPWLVFLLELTPMAALFDLAKLVTGEDGWNRKLSWEERALAGFMIFIDLGGGGLFIHGVEIVLKGLRAIKPILKPLIAGWVFWELSQEGEAEASINVPGPARKLLAKLLSTSATESEKQFLTRAASFAAKRALTSAERKAVGKALFKIAKKASAEGIEKTIAKVPRVLREAWPVLQKKHPLLSQLSIHSLQHAAEKVNAEHIKGALLEQIVNKMIRQVVKTRWAHQLFNVQHYINNGFVLEFIPGHLITDVTGRQLTDGVLRLRYIGMKVGDELVEETAEELAKRGLTKTNKIAVVIECKAGAASSRGLRTSGVNSIAEIEKKLGRKWRQTLTAMATEERNKAMQVYQETIAKGGKAKKVGTLKQFEEKIFAEHKGMGQIQRDAIRLEKDGKILIDGVEEEIEISRATTQYWGFIPSGLETTAVNGLENEIRKQGFDAYIRKVPVSAQALQSVADDLAGYSELLYHSKFVSKTASKLPK